MMARKFGERAPIAIARALDVPLGETNSDTLNEYLREATDGSKVSRRVQASIAVQKVSEALFGVIPR